VTPRVVVVGGGISGLTSAFLLAQHGLDVRVLEPERPGGKIQSELKGGFLLEHAAQGFLDNAPESLALARALALPTVPASGAARKRYLAVSGRLVPLPSGPLSFLRSPLLPGLAKLRLLVEPWVRPGSDGDESVASFVSRRLGPKVAETFVAPMVAGIYAGDPAQLSIAAAFPRLARLEAEHGSLLAGMRKGHGKGGMGTLTSFAGGMGDVVMALAARLGDRIVRTAATAIEPTRTGSRRFTVRTQAGSETADHVVVTTPGFVTAELLGAAAAPLAQIPYAAVDVVCLGYTRGDVPHPLDGFGFLTTPGDPSRVLGCLWESSLFAGRAPTGHVLLRVMLGGARDPELSREHADQVIAHARDAVRVLLGVRAAPKLAVAIRHARGIPQYTLGHRQRAAAAERLMNELPGLHLAGNALSGVGYNDCVRAAYALAEKLADRHS
jgi:oxygen-dependent protoporphyrinogen oxidase